MDTLTERLQNSWVSTSVGLFGRVLPINRIEVGVVGHTPAGGRVETKTGEQVGGLMMEYDTALELEGDEHSRN